MRLENMQKKSPLSSRPPLKKSSSSIHDPRLKEFIEAAESPKKSGSISLEILERDNEKVSFILPWEEPNVREDIYKVFNLRLPEAYYKKLIYLSEKEKESKHKILMDIICPEMDKRIKELL
jgi:hypothetical protein